MAESLSKAFLLQLPSRLNFVLLAFDFEKFFFRFPELVTLGENADFTFDVKEPEYVTYDKTSGIATAVKLGETTVCFPHIFSHYNALMHTTLLGVLHPRVHILLRNALSVLSSLVRNALNCGKHHESI